MIISASEARKNTKSKNDVVKDLTENQLRRIEAKILKSMDNGEFSINTVTSDNTNVVHGIVQKLTEKGYKVTWDIDDEDNVLSIEW